MSSVTPPRRSIPQAPGARRAAVLATVFAVALFWSYGNGVAFAQGYRDSLAGEAASAGRRQPESAAYNLLVGPVRLKLDAGLAVEYNDNVFAAGRNQDRQGDLFLRPALGIGARWKVTQLNELNLKLGLGYEFSLNHTRGQDVSPVTISPDSRLNFDVFVGDFRITFSDGFSLSNNPSTQSAAAGTIGFSQFSNDFGITVLWDLNEVLLSATVNERTDLYTGSTSQNNGATDLADANRNTHGLRLSSTFLFDDTTTWGIQGSGQLSNYEAGSREQTLLTAGPFVQFQVSPYTRFLLSAGAQYTKNTGGASFQADASLRQDFNASATVGSRPPERGDDGSDLGYYWSASVMNRLNASFTHDVSAGHERVFGIAADYQDIDYVRYNATWNVLRSASLSGTVSYEEVSQLAGPLQESYRRWTFGVAVGYKLTEHLGTALRYTFYSQNSDQATRVYDQTVTTLSLSYDF